MAHVYMLECSDGSLYVGSTTDLERRLAQHANGEGASYTRRRRPVTLIWNAEFASVADAFRFEKQVQGWSRRKRLALARGDFGEVHRLASRAHANRDEAGGGVSGRGGG